MLGDHGQVSVFVFVKPCGEQVLKIPLQDVEKSNQKTFTNVMNKSFSNDVQWN
jgi:hypothetical protein